MPRILLVHQPTDGGVGRHLHDLALGLSGSGHEVVLCGPALPRGLPPDFPHERCDLVRAISPRRDRASLVELGRIMRRVRPEIVHAHSSKAGAVARLQRLSTPRNPLVYTPHGYAFRGHFSRDWERILYRELERGLSPLATRVLCVCEAEARLARTISPPSRVRVVHNGIDAPAEGPIEPRMVELARRGPVLCALTLLRPGKGLETLIDATPLILARHPTVQVAIWGDGPDLEALKLRASSRAAHAVHFLGTGEDPYAILRGARIFVHPSWAEAFPYVILEAMSVGVPIVASDVGGIGEALVNDESALLVAPKQVDALARALITALEQPSSTADMAESARSRVNRSFTLAGMVDGVANIYDEALS